MAKYDLTNALEKSFTFSIEGKEFEFTKPTVREMRVITNGFAAVNKEEDLEKKEVLAQTALDEFYKFVKPMAHEEYIGDVLNDLTVDVQMAFNDMIQKELGVGQ